METLEKKLNNRLNKEQKKNSQKFQKNLHEKKWRDTKKTKNKLLLHGVLQGFNGIFMPYFPHQIIIC